MEYCCQDFIEKIFCWALEDDDKKCNSVVLNRNTVAPAYLDHGYKLNQSLNEISLTISVSKKNIDDWNLLESKSNLKIVDYSS